MCAINVIGLWLLTGFSATLLGVALIYREFRKLKHNFGDKYGNWHLFRDLYISMNSWKTDPRICKYIQNEDRHLVLASESVRGDHAVLHSFRSMSLIDARRRNARPFRFRHSQSLASLRHRPSHAKVRSTTHRLGKTTKPAALSDRLTISTLSLAMIFFTAARNFGP